MPDNLSCSKCGSESVIPRLRLVERAEDGPRHDVQLEMQRRPTAMFFKRPERSAVWARLCAECGFTELYADAPQALYHAWLEAEANPSISAAKELEQTRKRSPTHRFVFAREKLAMVARLLEGRIQTPETNRATRNPS